MSWPGIAPVVYMNDFTPSMPSVGTPAPCSRIANVCWYDTRLVEIRCGVST
jgi:hypothetical protein